MRKIALLFKLTFVILMIACVVVNGQVLRGVGIGEISVIELASGGNTWAGTYGTGVAVYNPDSCNWTYYDSSNTPMLSDSVTAIKTLNSNDAIVGTTDGAYYFHNNVWSVITGLINANVTGISLSLGNKLYISTISGISAFQQNVDSSFYHTGDLEGEGSAMPFSNISAVQANNLNNGSVLYAGTPDSGYFYTTDTSNGANPRSSLVQAANGLLYGMTERGGANNHGVIFSYNTNTATYIKLWNFGDNAYGINPIYALIQANNNLLYGVTAGGGANNSGVIFSYDINANKYTKLHDFSATSGGPAGSLMKASNNLLYGMTPSDGVNNNGIIFSYNIVDSTYSDIFDFSDTASGSNPQGGLIQASNGLLYGITASGGVYENGVLFSYNTNTAAYAKLLDVNDGGASGSLIQSDSGLLYGVMWEGGVNDAGLIFSYNPADSAYSDLFDFEPPVGGYNPMGTTLTQASNGVLYGMTWAGGANLDGTLFSYNPSDSLYSDLFSFNGANGLQATDNNLIQADNGLLYGMTYEGGSEFSGGSSDYGIMFSYNISTSAYTKLMDFNGADAGSQVNTTNSSLVDNRINFIKASSSFDTIYIGTKGGLSIDTDALLPDTSVAFVNYTAANGLPENDVTALDIDCRGFMWVGTRDSGISVYNGTNFTKLRAPLIPSNKITGINCNSICNCWVGSADSSIVVIDSLFKVLTLAEICPTNVSTEVKLPWDIKVFPQPASSEVNFRFSNTIEQGTLSVTDLCGSYIQSFKLKNQASTVIDVSAFAPGMYFYTLPSNNLQGYSGKIIILR